MQVVVNAVIYITDCDRNPSGTIADVSYYLTDCCALVSFALRLNLFLLRAALFRLSGVSACGFSMTLSPCACIMRSPPTPDLLH